MPYLNRLSSLLCAAFLLAAAAQAQFIQQGSKLSGNDSVRLNAVNQGISVALAADGNTLIVGGKDDNGGIGAAWVYTRSNGVWTQQGAKLTAADPTGSMPLEGTSVSLSADGNTALVGGPGDNGNIGAVWIYTRSNGVWTQQGNKLVGSDYLPGSQPWQGIAVSLSSDGNTALVGGSADASTGAAWVFHRAGTTWTQMGSKLVGSGSSGAPIQGRAVALSGDGNTAIVGGPGDNQGMGGAWVFTQSGSVWTQQGSKLFGTGSVPGVLNTVWQGSAVALSNDGNTALVGGREDNGEQGAAWVFVRSGGTWSQQGGKLTPINGTGTGWVGASVSLSSDGNTALIGGPYDTVPGILYRGAGWIFTRSGTTWTQSTKLFGSDALFSATYTGMSAALSADGTTAALGGPGDSGTTGATWVFGPALGTHLVLTAPAAAAAGTAFNVTVSAQDVISRVVTGYSGTVHFTSTDPNAILPGDTALTNGTGTFSITLKTTGNQTVTATDVAVASLTANSGTIAVSGGPVTHLAVSAPAAAGNGVAFNFTVTAQDAANNTSASYNGTVHFTSSDASAVLPANATLTNGVGTFSATLKTNGSQTLTATDTVTSSIKGTSAAITVAAPVVTHFSISAPAAVTAGQGFSVTVTAQDAANNTIPSYAGTVHFTSIDTGATLPANATLTNGTGSFTVTLQTAGTQTVTATDTITATITGSSGNIAVGGTATHFSVAATASVSPGVAFNVTVTALDSSNNTVTNYLGTVHLSSTDAAAVLPLDSTLTNGTKTFSVTLKTPGAQSITAADTAASAVTGTSGTVTVANWTGTHFVVTAPASATAGTSFQFTVTAKDAANTTISSYAGTVSFSSSDAAAIMPPGSTLTNGTGTFNATLKTAGGQLINVTDGVASGSSATIAVSPGAVATFVVTAPASATAGAAFNFTVTAKDACNNTNTTYSGAVRFSSGDAAAVLPLNSPLVNGTATFSATLKTAGSQTVTVTDTVTASVTGTSGTIAVTGGAATHFVLTAPATATSGTAFNFTVSAKDAWNNPASGYAGSVHFTSGDTAAVLPANSTLTSGAGTFSAILKTTGNQTLTATDTVTATLTGTSATIAVSGAAAHFAIWVPGTAAAGTAFTFSVTAQDASNNTITGYSGTVHFTSSDGNAVLPANATLANGIGSFSATLKTAGQQTITATDVAASSMSGSSAGIAVANGTATHFAVAAPATAVAGTSLSFTVTAQDAYNNTSPGYTGTVHFTGSDTFAILPADATLINGTGTGAVTFKTAGNQAIIATDTVTASITGHTSVIAVAGGAATHFQVAGPAAANAGAAIPFTVTAQDAFNNTSAAYSGQVHFISSDTAAILPANTVLLGGTGSFTATLKSVGGQTLTATDTVTASITGTSPTITVSVGTVTRFAVSAPASTTSGTSFTFTVTAQDSYGNKIDTYSGTVHFSSSDTMATLPANATLANGAGTLSATLKTAGNQTLTAADTTATSITGTSGTIAVGGGAATHLMVAAPAAVTAGTAFTVLVTARDAGENTSPGYSGILHFTSSDPSAVLPTDAGLTNGSATFQVTAKTSGTWSVTATDTVNASLTGTSAAIAVTGGAAARLVVAAPATATAGTALTFTVTAQDAFNNTSSTYAGTVHFTSGDVAAVLPANAALTNGTGSFSATLKTAGGQTLSATDTVTPSVTGTSGAITVSAAGAAHLVISAATTQAAGSSFSFTVTAVDAGNHTNTGYSGTVHFASSDAAAVLPGNATLTSGTGTFTATLKTAGYQTITATDTVTASNTGTSSAITVTSGAATHLAVAAPAQVSAGTPFSITVVALDAYNNQAAGYSGTVHFTGTDAAATLPADASLTSGTGNFSAVLKTSGSQTITAADLATATLGGTSSAITVTGGPATHFTVAAPASATPGTSFSFTVTALDAFNNVSPGYAGTMHCTSTDAAATLPANWMLTNGTGTFSATLKTAGAQSITATDTVTASIAGTSGAIAVGGGTGPVMVTPGAGSGTSTVMTFTFSDPRGWQDLDVVNILLGDFLDGRHSCYLAFSQPARALYLVNDAGTALSPGLTLNGSGSIGNSQCMVTGSGSSVAGSGNTLTLTLNLSFSIAFSGYKVNYLAARDLEGGNSGWQPLGTWQVPDSSWSGPEVGGVAPARSVGSGSQTFTFTFADTAGWQDLGVVNILVNDALNGNQACYLAYSRAANTLYLVNDAGNALLPGLLLNGSGTLSNSQCAISGAGSSASGAGTSLTLSLKITFTSSFTGNRVIYMAARSNGDVLNSGWEAAGSRTIQ